MVGATQESRLRRLGAQLQDATPEQLACVQKRFARQDYTRDTPWILYLRGQALLEQLKAAGNMKEARKVARHLKWLADQLTLPWRTPISKKLRARIFKTHGRRCFYCGGDGGKYPLELDHMVPVAQGGQNDETNLVPACKHCNLQKHARTYEQWQERQGRR